jgi:hypothetical protein
VVVEWGGVENCDSRYNCATARREKEKTEQSTKMTVHERDAPAEKKEKEEKRIGEARKNEN